VKRAEPRWVSRIAVEVIHAEQLAMFGGRAGLRDEGALEAGLGRPRNKWSYDPESDLSVLGAAYAFGLARNHPFVDGNKRTAFLTMVVFLGLNGRTFDAPESEVVTNMLGLASGTLSESKVAVWIQQRASEPRRRRRQ
jgi:death on curing protein